MQRLNQLIDEIKPLDSIKRQEAQAHLNQLTKPPGSLGVMEDLAKQLAGITGEVKPQFPKKAVIVMAGDHGICEEGVSAFPAEVTPQMVQNFLSGGAAVNVLARHVGADVVCVDIGVNAELSHPQLLSRKIRFGTGNMTKGPAMSREEAIDAIMVGVYVVEELIKEGYTLFATGEMGIGNTTASAAIMSVLTDYPVEEVVGHGTGIDDQKLIHKQDVIKKAITVNQPNREDPLDVLAKVGGLEIAGLVGVIIGSARNNSPVIIDGFISSVAALIASKLAPQCLPYMIGSHLSHEQGHKNLLEVIGLNPILHMEMRLGEGTGAVLGMSIVDATTKIMSEMATFASAGVAKN